ncbi:hypothetical protein BVRB_8g189960 [Beta vulgaris subsp. vulgaris]|nr:hypothetical protein BVRB_8g189960 [Beta vulgaris subsp. vulgaris]
MHKLKRNALAFCQVNLEIAQNIREEGEKLSQDSISLDDSEVFNPDFLSQIDDICKRHLEAKDSANKVDPTISLLVKRPVELELGRNENVPDLDSGVHGVEEKEGRDEDKGGDKDAVVHGDGEEGGNNEKEPKEDDKKTGNADDDGGLQGDKEKGGNKELDAGVHANGEKGGNVEKEQPKEDDTKTRNADDDQLKGAKDKDKCKISTHVPTRTAAGIDLVDLRTPTPPPPPPVVEAVENVYSRKSWRVDSSAKRKKIPDFDGPSFQLVYSSSFSRVFHRSFSPPLILCFPSFLYSVSCCCELAILPPWLSAPPLPSCRGGVVLLMLGCCLLVSTGCVSLSSDFYCVLLLVRRCRCRHSPAMLLPPLSRCCSSILATKIPSTPELLKGWDYDPTSKKVVRVKEPGDDYDDEGLEDLIDRVCAQGVGSSSDKAKKEEDEKEARVISSSTPGLHAVPVNNHVIILCRSLQQYNKYLSDLSPEQRLLVDYLFYNEYEDVAFMSLDTDSEEVKMKNQIMQSELTSDLVVDFDNPHSNYAVQLYKFELISMPRQGWLTSGVIDGCAFMFNRQEEESPSATRRFWFNIMPFAATKNLERCRLALRLVDDPLNKLREKVKHDCYVWSTNKPQLMARQKLRKDKEAVLDKLACNRSKMTNRKEAHVLRRRREHEAKVEDVLNNNFGDKVKIEQLLKFHYS